MVVLAVVFALAALVAAAGWCVALRRWDDAERRAGLLNAENVALRWRLRAAEFDLDRLRRDAARPGRPNLHRTDLHRKAMDAAFARE